MSILVGLLSGLTWILVTERQSPQTWMFLAAVLYFGLLGAAEDFHGLSVYRRLGLQLTGTTIIASIALTVAHIPIALTALLALGGVFYINASNFMDGVNGISGIHGILVGGYFATIGASLGEDLLFIVAMAVTMSYAAFLPWNFPRAAVFMGDSGSYLLGAASWFLAAWTLVLTHDPTIATAPLMIYTLDVVVTLARRLIRREDLSVAHRDHMYQRLHQATGSHVWAASINAIFTAMCGFVGLLKAHGHLSLLLAGFLLIVFFTLYALATAWIRLIPRASSLSPDPSYATDPTLGRNPNG